MLWTDADFVSVADLASVDTDIQEVATAQTITLTGPTGVIRNGIMQAGRILEGALVSFATYIASNDLSSNHLGAVFYTGSQPNQRRRSTLEQICINGRAPGYQSDLMAWVVNQCIIEFYVNASNRAQDDRFSNKLDSYRERDKNQMWPLLKKTGCPLVYTPMPVPAAAQALNPGFWEASLVDGAGTLDSVDVDVAISYVDQRKYISQRARQQGESDLAARQTLTMVTDKVISIDISQLNPPNAAVQAELIARGFPVPGVASGWNIWAGPAGGSKMYLQNATPLPITLTPVGIGYLPVLGGTTSFTFSADPVFSGYVALPGQYPDQFLSMQDMLQRG